MYKMQEKSVQSLCREDPMEEEMAAHSSILPGKPYELWSLVRWSLWGRKRVRYDLATKTTNSNNKNEILFWGEERMCLFPRAAITKDHRLSGFKWRFIFLSSEDLKSEVQVLAVP